ncbi:hypothetical protein [Salegentibacter flavus]|uniref:Outer membrane protein beta-barrel domain-containing protein n=1 Tax=Salegentibacter flavus TaxID=287099 RepID=A0A1I5A077_9FLAO|nr:hypothetical protein [Salegentibacter flavus]SFN55699.1 hypothetical protein SAMN05660413_01597 [Salegentibacter flavus]
MKEKKNIDRLYQEKFKDFEASPSPGVWKNIADRLEEDKRKKPLILPIWFKIAGAAAMLAILLSGGYFVYQNNFFGNTPGMVFEFQEIKRPQIETSFDNKTLTETGNLLQKITSDKHENSSSNNALVSGNNGLASSGSEIKNEKASAENSSEKEESDKNLIDQNTALAETESFSEEKIIENSEHKNNPASNNRSDSTSLIAAKTETDIQNEKDSIAENAIASLEEKSKDGKEEKDETETGKSRLSLSTFAAPVVYDNFGKGNPIDPQFAGNPSSQNLTMAYGVNVSYQLSNKLKIRSGIGKVAMSYDIQDVMFSAAIIPNAIASIDYSPEGSNFQIQGNSGRNSYSSAETSFAPESASRAMLGEINQQFGYIEIPLEIEYKLIDKKIGLNIIGGGSSLILDENTLLLNSNNQSAHLGEANNINDLSFSTNIGLGVDYKLTERFKLNLEPIFKYQINTFNNTQNLQPYYFGVYSGLSYKF